MGQQPPVSAREVAQIVGKSKSQINRDAAAGRIPVVQQYPGYNGPRLFDPEDVCTSYGREAS